MSIKLDTAAGYGLDGLHVSGPLEKEKLSLYKVKPGLSILTAAPIGTGFIDLEVKTALPCLIISFPFFRESERPTHPEAVSKPAWEDTDEQKICTVFGKSAFLNLHATASPLFMVVLLVDHCILTDLCRNSFLTFPLFLKDAMTGKSEGFFFSRPLDAAVQLELHQMLFLRPQVFGKKVYHERAALRLTVHEIERLARSLYNSTYEKDLLSPGDYMRLEKARSILVNRMDSPPDNKTLARWVGMNENKLKTGFKRVFGAPPKTFLRRRRMEAARKMLLTGGMSVTRVAIEVGYSNPSAFAACFSRYFGCKPSLMKR